MAATESSSAPAINPAEPGSAVLMYHIGAIRKHPAEVVVAALLAGRSVELPDGREYRLGADLCLGIGVGPGGDDGFVVPQDLQFGEFLRLCEQLSYNELFLIGSDRVLAGAAVERRRARERLGIHA
jgi:hypothetical protein